MFRVIIAGSRTFTDYDLLKRYADFKLKNITDDIQILSGHARGADALGERYALERGYSLLLFPADWGQYGRKAGYVRNEEMACNADALIAFWDGVSRGTRHMIHTASGHNLKIGIKYF